MTRAGPPSLRNEPWKPEQPAGNVVEQRMVELAARDVACKEWVERNYGGLPMSARENMVAATAFCAGWSNGVNYAKNNSSEPVDLRCNVCKSDD
jgi:hypothetical protein